MDDQLEVLNNVITELERNSDNIDLEDLDAMYNLRDRIERENEPVEDELFRFAVQPLVRRYDLDI